MHTKVLIPDITNYFKFAGGTVAFDERSNIEKLSPFFCQFDVIQDKFGPSMFGEINLWAFGNCNRSRDQRGEN